MHFPEILTEVFPWLFHSCRASLRVKSKDGARPALLLRHDGFAKVSAHSRTISACNFSALFKPQRAIQPKRASWALEFIIPNRGLQPILKIVSLSEIPGYVITCLLQSAVLQSKAGMAKQTDQGASTAKPLVSAVAWFGLACYKHSSWTSWHLQVGLICCPETSVWNYHPTLRNIPEQRRSHLHRGGSLNSPILPNFTYRNYGQNFIYTLMPSVNVSKPIFTKLALTRQNIIQI